MDIRVDETESQQLADLVGQIVTGTSSGDDYTSTAPFDRSVWDALEKSGLTELTAVAEDTDTEWTHLAVVLRELGRHAARVPFAEHAVLASSLIHEAGITPAGRIRTAAWTTELRPADIPWARDADSAVVLELSTDRVSARVAEIPVADLTLRQATNLAGEPRDRAPVAIDDHDPRPVDPALAEKFIMHGALARSVMIAGAAHRALDLVVEHVTTREQFGRPLAKFQAVQHLVADIAAESALIDASTAAAVDVVTTHGIDDLRSRFEISCAASCTGHAVSTIVRNAHQALGAMGYTHEHDLHRYTNRMVAWRSEFGSVRQWDQRVARLTQDVGRDGMWPLIGNS